MNIPASPRFLMCPPDFFKIEYEINPWMNKDVQNDRANSIAQWKSLHSLLKQLGSEIEEISPVAGLPDLVFTANAALVYENRAFISRFRHSARQGEEPVFTEWFEKHDWNVIRLPEDMSFEGAGDALFCGDTLFAGYIFRSEVQALNWIAEQIDKRVIPLQLTNEQFYHLDTCFCPLNNESAIYYPAAFDSYAQAALQAQIPNLIEVEPAEAGRFACNAVVIDKQVILNTGCPKLEERLRAIGYQTHATPLDEFLKAGGSAKCLTLRLNA
ncbi:N(G),N(G)-dimethylarginine dimethylaminohydrolase [Polystyrenella longa]|uniref:N(G),N(G)-dimethylarginine dimethylaminohydrolase n=1 Tax=Polystyrenella longa TaxID=2528007 RepID=A0A518CSE5_9PLAN|nr:arginine deiminase-related protein [Polystyrenella longa]QDU82135.1 N(G),N(G)-dimethylarginine dimethylaminohydrolase [Polystyrenella longa]